MWRQMWFAKICPICNKKVKKSELKEVEKTTGEKITCCEHCAKYFKAIKKEKW